MNNLSCQNQSLMMTGVLLTKAEDQFINAEGTTIKDQFINAEGTTIKDQFINAEGTTSSSKISH